MGVPYDIKEKLTTYENTVKMLEQLYGEAGISNINIKMSGWANGGMSSLIPSKIELLDELGGKESFKNLIKYCEDNGFGLFPEFDFTYITVDEYTAIKENQTTGDFVEIHCDASESIRATTITFEYNPYNL